MNLRGRNIRIKSETKHAYGNAGNVGSCFIRTKDLNQLPIFVVLIVQTNTGKKNRSRVYDIAGIAARHINRVCLHTEMYISSVALTVQLL
jgi:hypothetical protein